MLGLLSPEGRFFECKYGKHMELADKILNEKYGEESYLPVEALCIKGWISIQESFLGFVMDRMFCIPNPTKEQLEWLYNNEKNMNLEQFETYQLLLSLL